jgi:hypothetical protein
LAASQWERATILQVAAFTGAYGVSFVLVIVNLGFAAYAHRLFWEGAKGFAKRSQEFFFALFLLLACISIHFQEAFHRPKFVEPLARVAFVQPYIPQEVKWDPAKRTAILKVLEQATLAAATAKPDLILWPEAVTPLAVQTDDALKQFVGSLAKQAQAQTRNMNGPGDPVTPAILDALYADLVGRGVAPPRSVFDSAAPWISRSLGYEMTRVAFGADADFLRRTQDDSALQQAMELLQGARSPREVFSKLEKRAVAGLDALSGHSPHRPYIDEVRIACAKCGVQLFLDESKFGLVGRDWLVAANFFRGVVAW